MITLQAHDEAGIRRLLETHADALRAMDLAGVMEIYAPDVVSFDVEPPLQYVGREARKKPWMDLFALYQPSLGYEFRNLTLNADGEMAFCHCFQKIGGMRKTGRHNPGFWVRWTACFRKTGGAWLIVHEQVSVPVDTGTGRAMLDLEP